MAMDRRVSLLLGAFALSLFAIAGLAAFGLLAVASALAGATGTAPLVFVALDAAAPYLLAAGFVGVLSFLLLIGTSVAAVRRASLPRDERLARVARGVERVSGDAREYGLADRFEPTTEDRIEALKREYVDGEITELEYERRLRELLEDETTSEDRIDRELRELEREFER
ncbi:SHOCT domain-containing protein [Halorussus marinus]|uniref:SHOCT domain-containing protein n=1 Tax=Halorussus marinus TaxID=2505976 RepID=UPI00109303F4|nr:SHOCT domain-containing protein [Halorussus marinus]